MALQIAPALQLDSLFILTIIQNMQVFLIKLQSLLRTPILFHINLGPLELQRIGSVLKRRKCFGMRFLILEILCKIKSHSLWDTPHICINGKRLGQSSANLKLTRGWLFLSCLYNLIRWTIRETIILTKKKIFDEILDLLLSECACKSSGNDVSGHYKRHYFLLFRQHAASVYGFVRQSFCQFIKNKFRPFISKVVGWNLVCWLFSQI